MTTVVTRVAGRLSRRTLLILVLAAALLLAGASWSAYVLARPAPHGTAFPQNAAMEDQFGVRFSRVAVVGDGGLITLTYVVLDSEKASRFQSDTAHPPVLYSESRHGSTRRISVMKQGHTLRAGQTYYLVYQNTDGALKRGERVTIVDGGARLKHAPVL
jgi:hypothetical protein